MMMMRRRKMKMVRRRTRAVLRRKGRVELMEKKQLLMQKVQARGNWTLKEIMLRKRKFIVQIAMKRTVRRVMMKIVMGLTVRKMGVMTCPISMKLTQKT